MVHGRIAARRRSRDWPRWSTRSALSRAEPPAPRCGGRRAPRPCHPHVSKDPAPTCTGDLPSQVRLVMYTRRSRFPDEPNSNERVADLGQEYEEVLHDLPGHVGTVMFVEEDGLMSITTWHPEETPRRSRARATLPSATWPLSFDGDPSTVSPTLVHDALIAATSRPGTTVTKRGGHGSSPGRRGSVTGWDSGRSAVDRPAAVHGRPVLVPGAPAWVCGLDGAGDNERVPNLQVADAGGEDLVP